MSFVIIIFNIWGKGLFKIIPILMGVVIAYIAAIHAGFAEILGDKVTLLAEVAEWPDEIDLNRAEAARDRAEERISVKAETTDLKRAEFALHKALTRINAAGYK